MFANDLDPLIRNWPYEPDRVSVRQVMGRDKRLKLQLRIDLGVLQLEWRGRPDGRKVEGYASQLEKHQERLARFVRRCGASLGFDITATECERLREEMLLYYQRVVCLFVLDAYEQAIDDLDHCRRIIELCERFGADRHIIESMVAIVPHMVVMNTKAMTARLLSEGRAKEALDQTISGVCELLNHFCAHGTIEDYKRSDQFCVLERLRLQLAAQLDGDDRVRLRRALRLAVREERYEEAARIRDELDLLKS